MSLPARQSGALADLPAYPWGVPAADTLAAELGLERAAIDAAAADGSLRARVEAAGPEAIALGDTRLEVRHALRGALAWPDEAVQAVHHALVDAYISPAAASQVGAVAGVDPAGVDFTGSANDVWASLLDQAARQDKVEAVLRAALADPDTAAHHAALTRALDRPWRVDDGRDTPSTSIPPQPTPSIPPPDGKRPPWALIAGLAVAALVAVAVIGVVAVNGRGDDGRDGGEVVETDAPVHLRGRLASGVSGAEIVLADGGTERARVTVAPDGTFAFDGPDLDDDDDARVDPRWRASVALPGCAPQPVTVDRGAAEQVFTVAHAAPVRVLGKCRLAIDGVALEPGTIVALAPSVAAPDAPARYAVVDVRVSANTVEAAALGPWASCDAACAPAPTTCGVAASDLLRRAVEDPAWDEALVALADTDACPEDVSDALRSLGAGLEPYVAGALDPDTVRAVFDRKASGFRQCYDRARRELPTDDTDGTIGVRFTVAADGAVSTPVIRASTLPRAPTLEACLLGVVGGLRFDPPSDGAPALVVAVIHLGEAAPVVRPRCWVDAAGRCRDAACSEPPSCAAGGWSGPPAENLAPAVRALADRCARVTVCP